MKRPVTLVLLLLIAGLNTAHSFNKDKSSLLSLADSCMYWPYKEWKQLSVIKTKDSIAGREINREIVAFLVAEDKGHIEYWDARNLCLRSLKRNRISSIEQVLPQYLLELAKDEERVIDFDRTQLTLFMSALWLHHQKQDSLAFAQINALQDFATEREFVIAMFAAHYYDATLQSLCLKRDVEEAERIVTFLAQPLFNSFEYYAEAMMLKKRMPQRYGDFDTDTLPNASDWQKFRETNSRQAQIEFLVSKLKLLNCVQDGQPGDISYTAPQSSVSFYQVLEAGQSFWEEHSFQVINPFNELQKMKLSPLEVKQLLPYLLGDDYIPSYTYFRDFFPGRTLHKLHWVVAETIFNSTQKHFFEEDTFDELSEEEKAAEINKIAAWCDAQANKSEEDITLDILRRTNDWAEFYPAMEKAYKAKWPLLSELLVARIADFPTDNYNSQRGIIVSYIYLTDSTRYHELIMDWSKSEDPAVKFWSSLYLLKNSVGTSEYALNRIAEVLEQDDGTLYYPEAMDQLLANGQEGIGLAEKVLNKPGFELGINFPQKQNMLKKLLKAKSRATFLFLYNNMLDNRSSSGQPEMLKSDFCVHVVSLFQPEKERVFSFRMSVEEKKACSKILAQWFAQNFEALYKDQPNELVLDLAEEPPIYRFVDAPGE